MQFRLHTIEHITMFNSNTPAQGQHRVSIGSAYRVSILLNGYLCSIRTRQHRVGIGSAYRVSTVLNG